MSAPSSRQIEQALFEAALNIEEPGLRAGFLDRACAGDAALRVRLDRLLSAHRVADEFFDLPAPDIALLSAAPFAPPPDSSGRPSLADENTRIGRYRLLRRIGDGGCGVVYLAEQLEPVRREVALKVIRLGMDTERVIARFERERQSLALMNHPNVARVLDAGATESGRPFFVMELVEGAPITRYCDEHRLNTRGRLELFIQVCNAIQHAHQKGVLHRDIKPSNVLVAEAAGAAPAPKVIDFGIAKSADAPRGDSTFVDGEQLVGTPAYMSPEQAEPGRADVDTRADIYGLGALLYELLAGRPPFDADKLLQAGIDELRRVLREVEPPRPSRLLRSLPPEELARVAAARRDEPRALIDKLRRDLDWIISRAMEKDPARRYATVNALAADVARHLNDEPVLARPPSRSYRFRKTVRRHRVVFAAGAAVALALVAGLGVSTVLFLSERRALREQTRLLREAEIGALLTRAVFLTREGNFALADQVLAGVPLPLKHPSFDGVVAYRAVGNWLAAQRRWAEAARHFEAALEIGRLDSWGPVALDYQSCGVSLILAGDEAGYARFRQETVARFNPADNTEAVSRVLQTCLLRPIDDAFRANVLPLGARTEFWFSGLNPRRASGWAVIPISLWRYRIGDYAEARRLIDSEPAVAGSANVRHATLRLVSALCAARTGRIGEATPLLAEAKAIIEAGFDGDLGRGDGVNGYWYDWAFARILLDEAEAVVSSPKG